MRKDGSRQAQWLELEAENSHPKLQTKRAVGQVSRKGRLKEKAPETHGKLSEPEILRL